MSALKVPALALCLAAAAGLALLMAHNSRAGEPPLAPHIGHRIPTLARQVAAHPPRVTPHPAPTLRRIWSPGPGGASHPLPVPNVAAAGRHPFVGFPAAGSPFVALPRLGPPAVLQPSLAQLARHPRLVPGPLDGLPTPWEAAHRRPLAIMVENYDPDSRPQAGLNAASLVFETLAEGGITRFMPVYLEHDPPAVGPVRSARVYFNAWANGLHAMLVHVGGNDDAQAQLFHLPNIAHLDEAAFEDASFTAHVPFFWRSPARQMPHNLYTYPARVREHEFYDKIQVSGRFPATLPHRAPNAPPHRPAGGVLDLGFSDPAYAVQYRYDQPTNRYTRWMGGVPHLDAATGHQIAPSNVVVLLASVAPDPYGGPSNPGALYVQCTGTNRAYLFRDGYRYSGTWRKAHGGDPLQLLDGHGHAWAFNPGQTWIEVLPDTGSLGWAPGRR